MLGLMLPPMGRPVVLGMKASKGHRRVVPPQGASSKSSMPPGHADCVRATGGLVPDGPASQASWQASGQALGVTAFSLPTPPEPGLSRFPRARGWAYLDLSALWQHYWGGIQGGDLRGGGDASQGTEMPGLGRKKSTC